MHKAGIQTRSTADLTADLAELRSENADVLAALRFRCRSLLVVC